MHFMVKEMDIFFKSLRMTLLCFAVLMYGAPAAASMPSHDMSHTMNQTMPAPMVDSDCATHDAELAQADDCCQTDDCERACASHVNMVIIELSSPVALFEVGVYASYIDQSHAQFNDTSNPPPIS